MSIYAIDKAYVDFAALARIDTCSAFFSTWAKDNIQYEIIEISGNIYESIGLKGDYNIQLIGAKYRKLYLKRIRMIIFTTLIKMKNLNLSLIIKI